MRDVKKADAQFIFRNKVSEVNLEGVGIDFCDGRVLRRAEADDILVLLQLRLATLDDQREIFDGLLPGVGAGQNEVDPVRLCEFPGIGLA